jgi:hypothetical protein
LMEKLALNDEEYFLLDFDIQYHYDPTKYLNFQNKRKTK